MDTRGAPPDGESAAPQRWEHGSEFHWPSFAPEPAASEPWRQGSLWNTGRDALRALVVERGWRRLWIPSYFCQDVVRSILSTGVETPVYADAPDAEPPFDRLPHAGAGEAVLVVNYFGLRPPPAGEYDAEAEIVEDHTHDPSSPWARESTADWCLASLRKSLPAPAGGALWSPRGRPGPEPGATEPQAERDASRKLAAMLLKRLYMEGHPAPKEAYRSLATTAERSLSKGPVSAAPPWLPALIDTFPVRRWRGRRQPNLETLTRALADTPGVETLAAAAGAGAPFCAFLLFADRQRAEAVRQGLIARRIYPARLWDLDAPLVDGVPAAHAELAARSLALHCDHRYREADMLRVARAVDELCR